MLCLTVRQFTHIASIDSSGWWYHAGAPWNGCLFSSPGGIALKMNTFLCIVIRSSEFLINIYGNSWVDIASFIKKD